MKVEETQEMERVIAEHLRAKNEEHERETTELRKLLLSYQIKLEGIRWSAKENLPEHMQEVLFADADSFQSISDVESRDWMYHRCAARS